MPPAPSITNNVPRWLSDEHACDVYWRFKRDGGRQLQHGRCRAVLGLPEVLPDASFSGQQEPSKWLLEQGIESVSLNRTQSSRPGCS